MQYFDKVTSANTTSEQRSTGGICEKFGLITAVTYAYYYGHTRFTNRVTSSLGVRGLTTMRASCKLNGVSDALPLGDIQNVFRSIWIGYFLFQSFLYADASKI